MVLCRRTGRQRHLVPIVGVSSVCCVICTLCCWYVAWHGCSLWPQGVRAALRVGRLTSNCSTERHFTVHHEAVISGLAPESTCYACKCEVSILRTKLGGFFITLARFSRHACALGGLVQETLWGCGACGAVGIENWALRTVCKWSKSFTWLWNIWTEKLGLLGVVYISNLRMSQVAVFW